MPTYLHPGVYVEEVAGGARPIEAAGTSTTAFVGIADKGPLDKAEYISSFQCFTRGDSRGTTDVCFEFK